MADTLMYFKKLEAAGFTRKQAEVQVEIMTDFAMKDFATKSDIKELKQELKEFEQRVDLRFVRFEARFEAETSLLQSEISRMGDRITIRLGGMMILGFGALAALIKLG